MEKKSIGILFMVEYLHLTSSWELAFTLCLSISEVPCVLINILFSTSSTCIYHFQTAITFILQNWQLSYKSNFISLLLHNIMKTNIIGFSLHFLFQADNSLLPLLRKILSAVMIPLSN